VTDQWRLYEGFLAGWEVRAIKIFKSLPLATRDRLKLQERLDPIGHTRVDDPT